MQHVFSYLLPRSATSIKTLIPTKHSLTTCANEITAAALLEITNELIVNKLLVLHLNLAAKEMALKLKDLSVQKKQLFVPALEDIASVLKKGLKDNFSEVSVEVVDCPDLTQQPFTLASKGLNGKTSLVEVGGPPYLLPLVKREKVYDVRDVATLTNTDPAFIIGAGAGPHPYAGSNCEGILNVNVSSGLVDQHTRIAKVNLVDGSPIQEVLPNTESRFALLANLFVSEGKPGKVVKVHAKKRTGGDDFIASIRKSLAQHFGDKLVGLGGTFVMQQGKAKQHVMPDFSKTALNTEEDLNNWLKFYEMSAPLIAVGTLATNESDLDLRVQHFHSFSHHGEAGHYHIDVTPENVEYLGYFNVGDEIYRVDRPVDTHKIGRD